MEHPLRSTILPLPGDLLKILARFRSSSALWASPVCLAIPLYYLYASGGAVSGQTLNYAPTVISRALEVTYAFAYAFASGLAAWESAGLRKCGIWDLGPYRSRYQVAANTLLPVVALSWLTLILPAFLALAQTGTLPTTDALRPLILGLALCVGHAVIGFSVGLYVPRLIAAPLMVTAVWVLVSFSWSTEPFWLRHVSGQYPTTLMFGEAASIESLTPHLLFGGGIAVGVAVMWIPVRAAIVRIALASAIAIFGVVTAQSIASDWNYNPPLLADRADMTCVGNAPKVCMPTETASDLPGVHKEAEYILQRYKDAGVNVNPSVITDQITDGRYPRPSTDKIWRVGLTRGVQSGDVRYRLTAAAVHFPCADPDLKTSREVMLWAAELTGQVKAERDRVDQEQQPFPGATEVNNEVRKVLKTPRTEQADWFKKSLREACGRGA